MLETFFLVFVFAVKGLYPFSKILASLTFAAIWLSFCCGGGGGA
jgi:hypothetical protein